MAVIENGLSVRYLFLHTSATCTAVRSNLWAGGFGHGNRFFRVAFLCHHHSFGGSTTGIHEAGGNNVWYVLSLRLSKRFRVLYSQSISFFIRVSVHNMKCLCEQLFPVTAVLTFGVRKNVSLLVDHLARGSPVILPYDCDANHTPTLRNGKRAHWAVILGFLLASRDLNGHQTQQPIHLTPPLSPDQLSYVRSCCSTHDLFLYARQGKSRFLQLWRFEDLCDSNENLLQVSDKLNSTSHVLPENGDLSHSLADQLLLIEPVSVCK